MTDFPDDPLKPVNCGWFEEAKDKLPASEFDRQRSFLAELHTLAPAVIVWAVPNGSDDTDWSRIRKWKEGAKRGVPDVTLLWNHGSFYAEFKSGTGRASSAQIDMLNRIHRAGHRCGVYRKPATLIAHLREAGAPFLWSERSLR